MMTVRTMMSTSERQPKRSMWRSWKIVWLIDSCSSAVALPAVVRIAPSGVANGVDDASHADGGRHVVDAQERSPVENRRRTGREAGIQPAIDRKARHLSQKRLSGNPDQNRSSQRPETREARKNL